MDLAGALAYLDEHINLEATPGGPTAGVVHGLSLDRMRGLAAVLGDPQHAAPVIHVTGTNGKGSVARMVTSLLGAHGLTVGTYASPHLESITERISRNGEPIAPDEFARAVAEVAAVESLVGERPSYFELLTATALSWFAQEAVEVMVVEVGMLGRYDATNVVDATVAVVTNVGKDHTDGSGDWRRAIAEEKAGIITPTSTVVLGETDPDLVEVFRAEGGAEYLVRGERFDVESTQLAVGGRLVDLRTPSGVVEELFLPVHGDHQADNAAVALTAVEAFFDRDVDRDVAAEGFAALHLPGRCEVVSRAPLVILDGAHNPDGMAALVDTIGGEFDIGGSLDIVVGALSGRDPDELLAPLATLRPRSVRCVRAESPRAIPPRELAGAAERAVGDSHVVAESGPLADVLRRIVDESSDDDAVVVCGSHYVAGAARTAARAVGLPVDDGR